MELFNILNDYYEKRGEDERLVSRHGSVEFLTTVHYIEKYLQTDMKILEIGAGTGRYSHYFARKGYAVDAVELVPYNIEVFNSHFQDGETISVVQGNALDLSTFTDDTYDITLLLGPMYHLFTDSDKRRAISEAIRVTKGGGVIFAAYCNNDATVVQFGFHKGNFKEYYDKGMFDPVTFKCRSDPKEIFELYRKEEIDALMLDFPVTRLHYIGTDMATNFMRDTVDGMDDEVFSLYMQYHLSICERADMVGATHHILDIFKKN